MSGFAFASSSLSSEQAKNIWDALKKAVEEIQNGNASKLRFEELYRSAYTLVLHKHGDMLYKGVGDAIARKLEQTSATVSFASSDKILDVIVAEWERHKLISGMIRDILMYMDRAYCKAQRKTSVYDMAMFAFRDHCFRNGSINGRLKQILQEKVMLERSGEVIDKVAMKNCLSMMVEVNVSSLEVYQRDFEDEFLASTRTFYAQESNDFLLQNTVPDYLAKVEVRLKEEEKRANNYLDPSTRAKVRAAAQDELIVKHAKRLVEDEKTGCVPMFERNDLESLSRLYALFSREASTIDCVIQCMARVIKDAGYVIVQDPENLKNPCQFVQQVLDLRSKFNDFVQVAFKQDRLFVKCLKDSIEYFINNDNKSGHSNTQYSRSAQYLSLYIDDMLRKSLKSLSDREADASINNVLAVFRYLQDKDIFEDFYKQHLAGRLLTGTSINADIEKVVIAKLKAECGHQFTSRLEGMFKDIEQSKMLMTSFAQKQIKQVGPDISVTVLTTGFWPVQNVPLCQLPDDARKATERFSKYYLEKHSGRKLSWQANLGTAELICNFASGRKELLVHSYQMCILMLYNKVNVMSYKDIEQRTKIPETELQRQLLSLAHPKVRILKKNPNTKQMAPDHTFEYNTAYESKLFRVKIPLLSARNEEAVDSETAVPASILEARKNRVEASLVRVMKSRKTIEHNALVAEVARQLTGRFAVDPTFIKKRIESLIERDYIERDKDDRKIYHYMA